MPWRHELLSGNKMNTEVILYYKYINIPNPQEEVEKQKQFCQQVGLLGRILIGEEGINGTLEGTRQQIQKYKDYILGHEILSDIIFKTSKSETAAFNKLKVKYREEIVALNKQVDLKKAGRRITPEELHQTLENNEGVVLVDMRNSYESNIGRFKNAVLSNTENFRDLPEKLVELEKFKDKKVITYCTGGIRCEKASALLVENGFKEVYQLDGGIFKYAEKYPDGYFEGKCFVFDQRMSVSFEKERNTVLTNCEHCNEKSDRYLDCADDNCHRLFLCCQNCQSLKLGLCSETHKLVPVVGKQTSVNTNFSLK